jgi:hypothetical protein
MVMIVQILRHDRQEINWRCCIHCFIAQIKAIASCELLGLDVNANARKTA